MFYDEENAGHTRAYLAGEIVSQELKGVLIEISFTPQGKLLAAFRPQDFLQVSRLDMRTLLARALECCAHPSTPLTTLDSKILTIPSKT